MNVGTISVQRLSEDIHGQAQDVLKTADTCGIVRYASGRYAVIWPGLVDHWIAGGGDFLGCINRGSTAADVRAILEGI